MENTHRQVEYPSKSQSPRDNRRNWNRMMTQKLGNGFEFIKKACFVCGSFNHFIKDYNFHDNKMVEKPVMNIKGRVTTVATKSEQVPDIVAKQSSPRAAALISTVRLVNTAAPKLKVNDALPTTYSYFKAHSPIIRDDGGFVAFRRKSLYEGYDLVYLQGLPIDESNLWHRRCDNRTEFKNNDMNQFCGMKGIKRKFSVVRTPQQNGVAERKNKTLIEAARTMLVDSLLPTTFWSEAFSTACYVQNRVLVTKPHNKTPYELLSGRPPSISFMRPFGCLVTILNTLDPLGKFDGKVDEGFFIGYSINSKAFRVFNTRTRKVEKNLHITFLENKPNVAGSRPDWLFDIDLLTNSINYEPVTAGNKTNRNAEGDQNVQDFRAALDNLLVQQKEGYANSTNRDSTVSPSVSAVGQSFNNDDLLINPLMPDLEDTVDLLNTGIFSGAYDDEDEGAEADLNNLETTMNKVWTLVDLPKGKHAIGTKWVYRNKKDERGIVVRNKARLVAQDGCEECLLYCTIEEEVYVCQPPGFEDPQFPDKVYKVEKALYGLHQAPRAWYETLSTYLLENGFKRGTIDKTLFIKKDKDDAQEILDEFYGGLTFFLGLQVKQKDDGIFISQDKYVADILKKFDFVTMKTSITPIVTNKALLKDEEAEDVDVHLYRSMIRSLMYLTASRPNIMFVVCACARFQVTPKVSHLHAMKRIFRYLKGHLKGYRLNEAFVPKDSPFELEALGAVNKEVWDDIVVRATTTAASLDATQASGDRSQQERRPSQAFPPPRKRLYKHVDSSDDSLGEENASKQGRNDSNKTEEFNLSDKGSDPILLLAGDAVTAANVIPDIANFTASAGPLKMFTQVLRTTSVVIRDVEEEPRRPTSVPTVQSQNKVALDIRQMGEEAVMPEIEMVYKLESRPPVSKSSPCKFRT
ncbi:retrovirus-related pol polyprotein from transposon TNT 1-94 [Tanacetum coccineum]